MKTYFEHVKLNPSLKPVSVKALTLAIIITDDGKIFTGTATCGELDQFSKKRGRQISEGRAKKHLEAYRAKRVTQPSA